METVFVPLMPFVLYLLGPGEEPAATTIAPWAHVLTIITVIIMVSLTTGDTWPAHSSPRRGCDGVWPRMAAAGGSPRTCRTGSRPRASEGHGSSGPGSRGLKLSGESFSPRTRYNDCPTYKLATRLTRGGEVWFVARETRGPLVSEHVSLAGQLGVTVPAAAGMTQHVMTWSGCSPLTWSARCASPCPWPWCMSRRRWARHRSRTEASSSPRNVAHRTPGPGTRSRSGPL